MKSQDRTFTQMSSQEISPSIYEGVLLFLTTEIEMNSKKTEHSAIMIAGSKDYHLLKETIYIQQEDGQEEVKASVAISFTKTALMNHIC